LQKIYKNILQEDLAHIIWLST